MAELTQSSEEFQKLVAFENAYERVFDLIAEEGSLTHGGIVVQDSLSFLANLVRNNPPNQSLFRETRGFQQLGKLLETMESGNDVIRDDYRSAQRDKNFWGALALVRILIVPGSAETNANQEALYKHGLIPSILNIAFDLTLGQPIHREVGEPLCLFRAAYRYVLGSLHLCRHH